MSDYNTADNLARFTQYLEITVQREQRRFIAEQKKQLHHEIPIGDFGNLSQSHLNRVDSSKDDRLRVLQTLGLKPIDEIIVREHLINQKTFQEISDNSPALFGHWRSKDSLQKRYYRAMQALNEKGDFE